MDDELEIIIVDDCSPITAESVLHDYIELHHNVRVLRHTVNKRQGGAKNTGISAAKGKYIAFADQDDVINAEHVKSALAFAQDCDVDMLACHYNLLQETGEIKEKGIDRGDMKIMSGKEFCEHYFQPGCNLAPWANLYKREFLCRIAHPYEENVVMEDSDWIAWHWIHANMVGIYNQPIYTWVMNPSSITHSHHYINRADWIKYGYRKIRDARIYRDLSVHFSDVMVRDGQQNIERGMRKAWKVDSYSKFYSHIGANVLKELSNMRWSVLTGAMLAYPRMSIGVLCVVGPLLKSMVNVKSLCE
jgi:glycosyltransferase involved in cell wall biosynthesis